MSRFGQSLTRLWKCPTAIDEPVVTGPDDEGLVRKVIPAACASSPPAIPVYDTGRLVFWTSHARIKTWTMPDPDRRRAYAELHVQLAGRVSRAADRYFPIQEDLFSIPQSTKMRLFGSPHTTQDPVDDAAALMLSYVVVGQHHPVLHLHSGGQVTNEAHNIAAND